LRCCYTDTFVLDVNKSDVDDDVGLRLGAADQDIARGGRVERVGVVVDGSRDESGLAVVADTGAAGPSDWHVAGLGELQETVVRRGRPTGGDTAAGK